MAVPDVPQVADEPTRHRLTEARKAAVDLLMEAEGLEERARILRRKARSRMRHYENMVAEHQGQMSVLNEEGVM